MDKSPEAFRTISEAAEAVGVPAHVLRFWESRFPQVKPVKRAGGRRYYRPNDVELLSGIRSLLYDQGMTIRGVQKLLREGQVRPTPPQGKPTHRFDDDLHAEPAAPPRRVAPETKAIPPRVEVPAAPMAELVEPEPLSAPEVVQFGRSSSRLVLETPISDLPEPKQIVPVDVGEDPDDEAETHILRLVLDPEIDRARVRVAVSRLQAVARRLDALGNG